MNVHVFFWLWVVPLEVSRGEDDIVELFWKIGQVVRSSQTEIPSSDPTPILRGSGSGGGEENAPLPPLLPPLHHQNLFIQEDDMSSWIHHPLRQDYLCSQLYASNPAPHPQSSVSLAPPPSSAPYGQIIAPRREENVMDFLRLRGNILTGGNVEAGPWIPVGSSVTTSLSATEFNLTPAPESLATVTVGVSRTFAVPSHGRKEKAVAIQTVCEIAGTSSLGVETEPVRIQPATETDIADDRARKEREETSAGIQGTEEARGTISRKRSRAAKMHNLAERRRREKINEKMMTLQELIPRCNKSTKVSTLDDAIEYVKSLEMQIRMNLRIMTEVLISESMLLCKMMSTGCSSMPMMYTSNMQQFRPYMAMGMNQPPAFIPFPRQAHMAGVGPSYPPPRYPFPNIQTFDPSRVRLQIPQPNPVSNQLQMNPYSQFVGHHQMQQPLPPPLQSQTTSQLSLGQASSSKEPTDQNNQPTD
ncbi:Helix-loop-helix DNA-binding domain superfamily [Arabidopsis thaliana x Arabidopsis arenosa]|uniref:Helix-loop-helix DNA-binding domain superfamily n=1 Tax=Arabidopsis thaliana x Arabidopsis arenosa TaxID=1240361 RepID=A0A8T1Y1E1_9BRAS|nr:Helix-loop-helix DNA-binding domain superfamily [Arabidopsis thaliana x Arabidopsis arenosa]